MAHLLVGSVECAVSTATAAGRFGTVTTEASAALATATASGLGTRFGVVNCVSTVTAAATGLPTAFYGTAATAAAPEQTVVLSPVHLTPANAGIAVANIIAAITNASISAKMMRRITHLLS